MANRVQRGWGLTKQSLAVLKTNKRILIFPLISTIGYTVLLSLIARPLWHVERSYLISAHQSTLKTVLGIMTLLAALFLCNLIMIYCNSALIATMANYFKTKKLSLTYGLKAAKNCFPKIIMWTLFNTTIGFILRTFQSRLGQVTTIASLLLGIAWTIVSYFVVPILVLENVGPMQAIKQSAHALHKTWGRSLVSSIGLRLIPFAIRLIGLIPIAIALYIGGATTLLIGFITAAILLVLLTIISSAASNILRAALYLYAVDNNIALPYNTETIKNAFRTRKKQPKTIH